MENSFFILSDKVLTIERFHICTWDFKDRKSFIELGFEIDNSKPLNDISLTFTAPFLKDIKEENVICLSTRLKDRENSRFIFNDTIRNSTPLTIDNRPDDRLGTILDFEVRGSLTILPIKSKVINQTNGALCLRIKVPLGASDKIYFRILIELPFQTIAITKENLSKSMYLFDFKINEQRNMPDEVFTVMEQENLYRCKIENCFCLHIIPDTFEISFVDDKKLRNIRELEYSAFIKYLPEKVKGLKKEEHIIIFCKSSSEDSYTFFSTFNKEILGTEQIIFTLAANIFCSLLLFIATSEQYSICNLSAVPKTVWIVGLIFLSLVCYMGYLLLPQICRWGCNKVKRLFNKN